MKALAKLSKRRILVILICISVATSLVGSAFASRARMLAHWAIAPFGDAFMYVTSAVQRRDGGRWGFANREKVGSRARHDNRVLDGGAEGTPDLLGRVENRRRGARVLRVHVEEGRG